MATIYDFKTLSKDGSPFEKRHAFQLQAYRHLLSVKKAGKIIGEDRGLEFHEDGHVYTYEGRQLKSVSQLLDQFPETTNSFAHDQAAAERGTSVHEACSDILSGVKVEWVSKKYRPVYSYIDQFKKWLKEKGYDPGILHSEVRLCDPNLGLAGTIDLIADDGTRGVNIFNLYLYPGRFQEVSRSKSRYSLEGIRAMASARNAVER